MGSARSSPRSSSENNEPCFAGWGHDFGVVGCKEHSPCRAHCGRARDKGAFPVLGTVARAHVIPRSPAARLGASPSLSRVIQAARETQELTGSRRVGGRERGVFHLTHSPFFLAPPDGGPAQPSPTLLHPWPQHRDPEQFPGKVQDPLPPEALRAVLGEESGFSTPPPHLASPSCAPSTSVPVS